MVLITSNSSPKYSCSQTYWDFCRWNIRGFINNWAQPFGMWCFACGDVISTRGRQACLSHQCDTSSVDICICFWKYIFVKLNQNDYKYWDGSNAVSWKDLIKPNRLKLEVDKIRSRERHWGKLPPVPTNPPCSQSSFLRILFQLSFTQEIGVGGTQAPFSRQVFSPEPLRL